MKPMGMTLITDTEELNGYPRLVVHSQYKGARPDRDEHFVNHCDQ